MGTDDERSAVPVGRVTVEGEHEDETEFQRNEAVARLTTLEHSITRVAEHFEERQIKVPLWAALLWEQMIEARDSARAFLDSARVPSVVGERSEDELAIAQARGDAWRDKFNEDTGRLNVLEGALRAISIRATIERGSSACDQINEMARVALDPSRVGERTAEHQEEG